MFTGIIQNQGSVVQKQAQGKQIRFVFEPKKPFSKLDLGESIAVNGVCLTVAKIESARFYADVIRETLQATNLGDLKLGDQVNLERSLRWRDPMGGHFVSGHVDARGRLVKLEKDGKNVTLTFFAPPPFQKFLIPKGSIAVDGISLTIQTVRGGNFTIGIVPHTLEQTNMDQRKTGEWVNLEADLMIRYCLSLAEKKGQKVVPWEEIFLSQHKDQKGKSSSSKLIFSDLKKQGF